MDHDVPEGYREVWRFSFSDESQNRASSITSSELRKRVRDDTEALSKLLKIANSLKGKEVCCYSRSSVTGILMGVCRGMLGDNYYLSIGKRYLIDIPSLEYLAVKE